MARINIEECWWSDPRRTKLILKIGFAADAAAVNMWRAAQEFWSKGQALVPRDVFESLEFSQELVGCSLADVRGESVYVRGSSAYLTWLQEKREQARKAGKKSAARPRDNRGRLLKKSNGKSNETPAASSEIQPSGSGSYSFSGSDSDLGSAVECAGLKEPQALTTADPSPTALTWRAYREAYRLRYRDDATWNAKNAGMLKNFVQRVPVDEAPLIAAFYLAHNGARYVGSGHSIGLLLQDAEKLRTEWRTGTKITATDARNAEFGDSLSNQLRRLGAQ